MRTPKNKIFVALSGGVDSAVTAVLLKKSGYDVVGVYMREWTPEGIPCNEQENRYMAARIAAHLTIPFSVWDFREEYRKQVADYMIREYRTGRTPNPDIMCNSQIKFGVFLDAALRASADNIATGHYIKKGVSVQRLAFSKKIYKLNAKRYTLNAALDTNKDQSYFLWKLTQEQLHHCVFPLGEYTKPEVRAIAKRSGLPNWDRKDSQGICFVGNVDFGSFLRTQIPVHTGSAITTDGKKLGTHDGVEFYTIGQRIGISPITSHNSDKIFVVGKNIKTNTVVVANENDTALFRKEITLSDVHWISGKEPKLPLQCLVRTRYRQPLQKAVLYKAPTTSVDELLVMSYALQFSTSQRAIASGQSVVFYTKQGEMLGGGIIV
jgi:tRNA-uridine 2-sulfurtransferase